MNQRHVIQRDSLKTTCRVRLHTSLHVMTFAVLTLCGPVMSVSAQGDSSWWESAKRSMKQTTNFVMGRELLDPVKAREFYQKGDALFRQASASRAGKAAGDRERNQGEFAKAAKLFRKAHEADPDSALGQDSLFMNAESLFFADRLIDAADVYQQLQKDFPRSRHNDRVNARLFSISQYWIDTAKATDDQWFTLNLFDRTRPRLDVDGHAVRVLDQIRYDDPTGRLADDATMAAAAEYIRQEKYDMADEFLTDLRETFPDSEHFFSAHLLGIRCKMEVYAGPQYSNLMLEEAEKLIAQTRSRFPDKLRDEKTSEMIARASAEVAYRRAEHLHVRAQYREKRREFGAATAYYQEILDSYPDTPFGQEARQKLEKTSRLPPVPAQRLTWLRAVFPDERTSAPLEMNFESPTGEKRDTILR